MVETKRKCRVCGEKLHYLEYLHGGRSWTMQCLNHECKKYGKPG